MNNKNENPQSVLSETAVKENSNNKIIEISSIRNKNYVFTKTNSEYEVNDQNN